MKEVLDQNLRETQRSNHEGMKQMDTYCMIPRQTLAEIVRKSAFRIMWTENFVDCKGQC